MSSKKCSNCGSNNDLLLTNCQFCKTPLPIVDLNSISNEDLILKAGEWIGRLSGGLYIERAENANDWTGAGIKRMEKGEIRGHALKYISILEIRALTNPVIELTVKSLRNDYEVSLKKFPYYIKVIIAFILFCLAVVLIAKI